MSSARIIIADDDSIIRMDLKEQLTSLGYQVVGDASDAQTAIDLAKLLRPDLVMLDVRMPDSETDKAEGIRAARELTAERIAPCVLLTAFADKDLIASATDAGVYSYLVKPYKEAELAPAIEVALSRYREFRLIEDEKKDLEDALETRKVVERAKGVLMDSHGLKESEAFQRIRKASMDSRKPMRQIAEAILLTQSMEKPV